MGWGFRRRVRLLPGVTLNFSKSGISTTIGPKGANVNLGKKGVYHNLGLPGTGLYSRKRIAAEPPSKPQENSPHRSGFPVWLLVLGAIGLLMLFASGSRENSVSNAQTSSFSSPAIAAVPAGQSANNFRTQFVVATRLNCRAAPDPSARTIALLPRGARVDVIDNMGEWSEISRTSGNCWSHDRYLSNYPPPPEVPARALGVVGAAGGAASSRRSRPQQRYEGPSCPCSGSNVCIGPRGGRYCITSGGNKRYGV